MNGGASIPLNALLTIVLIVLVLYIFPFRDWTSRSRNKKRNQEATQRNQEQIRKNEEYRNYLREQNAMAQAKRDEQIRLLGEILDELKRRTKDT